MPAGQTPRPGRVQRRTRTLIHPAKDHTAARAPHPPPRNAARHRPFRTPPPPGTNPMPSRETQHAPGLPAPGLPPGGDRTRTDDPLLAKQVLSQLSYAPISVASLQVSVIRKAKPVVLTTDN